MVRVVDCHEGVLGSNPGGPKDFPLGITSVSWTQQLQWVGYRATVLFVVSNLPMVEINVVLKASSENLNNKQVFPTPESPINSNLNKRS